MTHLLRAALLACFLTVTSLGLSSADEGQKSPKIGQVFGSNPATAKAYDDAFRDGLRKLGYVDGKNIVLLPRYAQGDVTRFPDLLTELIAEHVDVLVIANTAVYAAKRATRTIPIVVPSMGGSPVEDGIVASLAHPGGNVTGGCNPSTEQGAKVMQMAKELLPDLKRMGLLYEEANPEFPKWANGVRELAGSWGLSMQIYGVRDMNEIKAAFASMKSDRVQALILWASPLMLLHRPGILELASHKIPLIAEGREYAQGGALLTVSADYFEMWRRGASYVDKILKGANPGDLPVEMPNKLDIRINLRAAKDFGVTIPQAISIQADEIIK